MTLSSGLVLAERPHVGDVQPPDVFEDMSRFGNDGVHAVVTWVQLPSGLWVCELDGATSQIVIPDAPSLKLKSAITCSCWINTSEAQTAASLFAIGKNDSYVLSYGHSAVAGWRGNLIIKSGAAWKAPTNAVTIGQDTWHHFVSMYDDPNIITYVDAEGTTQSIGSFTIDETATDLYLASSSNGGGNILGNMALFRLWNRALSAQEVADLFERERVWFGV